MIVTRAYITELEVREDQRQSVGVAVPHGVQIRVGRYLETFCPARSPTHPPALRHTAASLAIASGADVKVVQQMLGHKSATMTLDLYGHLFGDRLDVVADAMDLARSAALADVYPLCT